MESGEFVAGKLAGTRIFEIDSTQGRFFVKRDSLSFDFEWVGKKFVKCEKRFGTFSEQHPISSYKSIYF